MKTTALAAMTAALFAVSLVICAALCLIAPPAYFVARLICPRPSTPEHPF